MADYEGVVEPVPAPGGAPQQPTPQALSADRGWHWIMDAFRLVRPQLGMWILLCFIVFVCMALLGMVPLGFIASTLLQPILFAGVIYACSELERGEELEIGQLFIGFQRNPAQLALVGVISFAVTAGAVLVAMIPLLLFGGSALLGAMSGHGGSAAMAAMGGTALIGVLLFVLILTLLMVPLGMASWFAAALVLFNDMLAWNAFKLSFNACLRNIMPFFVYSLIAMVLCVLALLPLGLGLIVMLPLMMATAYTSYRDVFGV
ncbi:MAG: BPSS1780 family membrane protein [Chitinivorax sp.]